jgi:hypothetical protein
MSANVEAIQQLLAPIFPGLMGIKLVEAGPERVLAEMAVRADLCTNGGILRGAPAGSVLTGESIALHCGRLKRRHPQVALRRRAVRIELRTRAFPGEVALLEEDMPVGHAHQALCVFVDHQHRMPAAAQGFERAPDRKHLLLATRELMAHAPAALREARPICAWVVCHRDRPSSSRTRSSCRLSASGCTLDDSRFSS